ncbi:unnamed protein product [Effrenium voratum]|nr:unnamed protein product [Effrenium voratum]
MARNSGLSAALVLLGAACVLYNAVAPAFVATGLNRREALQAASLSIATLGTQAAWADAQGEPLACLTRYGPQILKLKDAVDKGDMETILKKEPKFKLLNSYWRNEPALFTKYSTLAEQLLEAADEGKKDEVKKLYKEYTSDPIFDALKTPIKRGHPMSVYNNGAGNSFADM